MPRRPAARPWRIPCAVVALACVGLWWGRTSAQQSPEAAAPPQTPVFRGGVNFVSVDAYPRRDGKVIEGLTAADFQLFEDGKPQKVETFEFIRIEPNPVDSLRRDPSSQADAERQARDPKNRVFVVYLDLAHTSMPASYQAQVPVVDFLTRTIGETDLFAYLTAEIPVSRIVFGRRTETIEGELAKYWTWGQSDRLAVEVRTPAERRLSECALVYAARNNPEEQRRIEAELIMLHREEQLQTSLENLMLRLRDLRDERKNVLFVSEGWVPRGPRDDLRNVSVSEGAIPQVGVGPGGRMGIGRSQQPFNTNYTECDQQIRHLASIDFAERFRDLLAMARRANVTFYPIDVGGLKVASGMGSRGTLLTLAENTDGIAITDTNDLRAGVRKVSDDLSAFYLLGYYSTNAATDGRFRSIEVKVNQPGVKMSARRGYVAPSADVMATRPSAVPAGPTAVDEALGRLAVFRDDTALLVHGASTGAAIDLTAEIASAAMLKGWQKGATVEFAATNGAGASATVSAAIAAGERGVRVMLPFADPSAGPWRIVARAVGPDGPVEARTDVPKTTMTLVGEPFVFRGAPSLRAPLKPVADFRLSRLERLRVEWPILDETATRVARLLDRKGQPLGAPLPFATLPAERRMAGIDLPLGALPEGDFVVELTATRGDLREIRLTAFRVTR